MQHHSEDAAGSKAGIAQGFRDTAQGRWRPCTRDLRDKVAHFGFRIADFGLGRGGILLLLTAGCTRQTILICQNGAGMLPFNPKSEIRNPKS